MAYLKWAGGKTSLLTELVPHIVGTGTTGVFYDAFAGSGAVAEAVADRFKRVHLNDANRDVAALHRAVLNHGNNFIDLAARFFGPAMNSESVYYDLRKVFNGGGCGIERMAILLYLNKHGFNGLCRYNEKGEYNVPFGKHKTAPRFPRENVVRFMRALGTASVTDWDFERVFGLAKAGDVIYCDPPYWPLSRTASFTAYASGKFSEDNQRRLADLARSSPATVIISNHDLPQTRELYAGAEIHAVSAPGGISAKATSRGARSEIIAIFRS